MDASRSFAGASPWLGNHGLSPGWFMSHKTPRTFFPPSSERHGIVHLMDSRVHRPWPLSCAIATHYRSDVVNLPSFRFVCACQIHSNAIWSCKQSFAVDRLPMVEILFLASQSDCDADNCTWPERAREARDHDQQFDADRRENNVRICYRGQAHHSNFGKTTPYGLVSLEIYAKNVERRPTP
ncbi:hypothetical protein BD289DRAFT_236815 [Coniella lustricola]|uniref:Uncharacterized protein n=1 Tax=Coniella lustricola TaxID=2025994 RepID=A0A2T3A9S7_9PEZI|nr:hypothetical protein BD289DRAFT_236815 [Coniella lustricola]